MRPGRAADHSPPSSAGLMEEQSYTSTHPLGHMSERLGMSVMLYVVIVRQLLRQPCKAGIINARRHISFKERGKFPVYLKLKAVQRCSFEFNDIYIYIYMYHP